MRIVIVRDVRTHPPVPDPAGPAPDQPAPAPSGPRRVRSEDLLKGGVELLIEHQGREYRLRVTQNGKLILTA
jgi:hemin uptake protein HemP